MTARSRDQQNRANSTLSSSSQPSTNNQAEVMALIAEELAIINEEFYASELDPDHVCSECMVSIYDTRDKEYAEHCRDGHRKFLQGCPGCEVGYMQAKSARASKNPRDQKTYEEDTVRIDFMDDSKRF